jgi:KGK domain
MNEQVKQIIPDSQSVVQCLDKDILEILNSGTFIIDDLLEKIKHTHLGLLSEGSVNEFFRKIRTVGNYGPPDFFEDLNHTVNRNINSKTITDILVNGTKVLFLQPDGKGWQKGQIKICFEFTPEEDEPVGTPEKQVETHRSPLDDIRASLVESN